MHIFLNCPRKQRIAEMTESYSASPVTQTNVGETSEWERSIPEGKFVPEFIKEGRNRRLHQRCKIGAGQQDYRAAVEALSRGTCFDLQWVEPVLQRPLESQDTFCLIVRAFGFCSVNFCRVVYLGEQATADSKFFAIGIGTLKRHAAIGEERVSVNWNQENDDVHFLIDSYSRPSSLLSRVFAFYLRRQQLKFVDQACKRLKREINK